MTPREPTLEIVRETGERYDKGLSALLSNERHRPVAWARFHCYAELYSRQMTASEIGRVFNRDHSTILHGIKRAAEFQYNMFPRWACHKKGKRSPRFSLSPPIALCSNVHIEGGCHELETA